MLTFNSLQGRIFSLFISLLLLLLCTAVYLIYNAARENFEQQTQAQLQTGERLFINELSNRNDYLSKSVSTISQDWAFRSAIGQSDSATIRSTLVNHSHRIDADLAVFIGEDRQIISTGDNLKALDIDHLLALGSHSSSKRLLALSPSGKLYQLVVSPVKAPLLVGWLVVGFGIDESLANHFGHLSSLNVSFLVKERELHFIASALPTDVQQDLRDHPVDPMLAMSQTIHLGPQSEKYLLQAFPLPNDMTVQAYVVLAQSLADQEAGFQNSFIQLSLLLITGSALCALLAYFVAQTVSRPIKELLAATREIRGGNYDNTITVKTNDEIGKLSTEFNHMQHAIVMREKEIHYRTIHDDVTPLLNRHGILDTIHHHIEEKPDQPLVVSIVEFQNFRQVNETLGHSTGDNLLTQAAQRLLSQLPQDQLAHLGNGRFAFLHNELDNRINIRVQQTLELAFDLQKVQLTIGLAIGYAQYPAHGKDAQTLLRQADVALNNGKEKHLDISAYDPANDLNSVFRLSLLHELRNAIRLDKMVLYFQPKLCLRPGPQYHQIAQVECLVRMYHSDGNLIGPDQFVPIAEQSGAICELTAWVLEAALKQCQAWQKQGLEVAVAINISALDLIHGRLPQLVSALLQKYQLSPQLLILEVIESVLAEDPKQTIIIMEELRACGVSLSVDDYGTGYSSLAQLKQIPAKELKIDQAFIRDILGNDEDPLIVRSTIEMAHHLQLTVTAEGIEDEASLALLESYGCDYAQGYFIAKPMTNADFVQWQKKCPYTVRQRQAVVKGLR